MRVWVWEYILEREREDYQERATQTIFEQQPVLARSLTREVGQTEEKREVGKERKIGNGYRQ